VLASGHYCSSDQMVALQVQPFTASTAIGLNAMYILYA